MSVSTPAHAVPCAQPAPAPAFAGSPALAQALQQVLVDLTALHLDAKQAHWNVVGATFREVHLHLDEIVDEARQGADDVAERMRALDLTPDGRPRTVAATTTLPVHPEGETGAVEATTAVLAAVRAVVATLRTVHDPVDDEDPTSADLLHTLIAGLEKHAWMLQATLRAR